MTPTQKRDLALLVEAYLLLLRLSHQSTTRLRMQSVLASLAREIAELTDWPDETVQNTCEAIALMLAGENQP